MSLRPRETSARSPRGRWGRTAGWRTRGMPLDADPEEPFNSTYAVRDRRSPSIRVSRVGSAGRNQARLRCRAAARSGGINRLPGRRRGARLRRAHRAPCSHRGQSRERVKFPRARALAVTFLPKSSESCGRWGPVPRGHVCSTGVKARREPAMGLRAVCSRHFLGEHPSFAARIGVADERLRRETGVRPLSNWPHVARAQAFISPQSARSHDACALQRARGCLDARPREIVPAALRTRVDRSTSWVHDCISVIQCLMLANRLS
jgi:hypothetical protein